MDRKIALTLNRNRRASGCRRGVAAVEAALLLPVALILMLGTWEIGRMVEVEQILNNAAREGGRAASGGQDTNSQVQQVVLNYLQNAGLPSASATVTVSDPDESRNRLHGGNGTRPVARDGQFAIQLRPLVGMLRWLPTAARRSPPRRSWYSNNGQSYPTSITVPQAY